MNLNDLRRNAYLNNSKSDTEPKEISKPLFKNVDKEIGNILSEPAKPLFKVPAEDAEKKDSVYRRVAKFLVLIGVDEASKILPLLSPEQTEKIIPEIASIRTIGDKEADDILIEFQGLYKKVTETGGKETARTILEKAYGPEKAEAFLQKTAPYEGGKPFSYLKDSSADKVLKLLQDESDAVKTLVLSNLEPKKAAGVINLMKPEDKAVVIKRLAKMQSVSPEILNRVDQAMKEKASAIVEEKSESLDGRNALAAILKKMSPGAENELLSTLETEDPELGEDLRSRLFTIDDIIKADSKFIQEKLHEMDALEIVYLIAGKPAVYREKLLSCVSSARRQEILEEEEIRKPFRKKDIDEATSDFITIMRRAFENGDLIISGRNDDEYVK